MRLKFPLILLVCWFSLACSDHKQEDHIWEMHIIDNTSSGADGTKLADVNGDGLMDIVSGWEQGNVARLYKNPGDKLGRWEYVEVSAPNVEDALPVDLDQDGFYDLVTCSEGDHMRISFHWAPSDTKGYWDAEKWESVDVPATIGKTRWMFAQPMDVDGKNGIDLIVGSKDPNATLGWLEAPANPRDIDLWKYHEISPANWIMSIEILDLNGDAWKDILISDRNGPNRGVRWLKNPGQKSTELYERWTNIAIGMTDADPLFLDIVDENKNGLHEIWVPNLREYFMHFEQVDASAETWKAEKWIIPEIAGLIGKSAAIADIDKDGQNDLISTYDDAEERSGVIWSSFDETTKTWTHHDVSGKKGIKYDFASLLDMDGDGDLDVLTCEEANNSRDGPGLGVIWYENPLQSNNQ